MTGECHQTRSKCYTKRMKYTSEYQPPTLTVDAVVFQIIDEKLQVLLVRRSQEPFKDQPAVPGGYNPQGETTNAALKRITLRKAGVDIDKDLKYIEQLYTFDTVARDPRGHAVSVSYMGCGRDVQPAKSASERPFFIPVDELPELPYDHADIILYARDRLRSKLTYTNAVYAFLPGKFTLTQLQHAYETILGKELDKRNFRKKFLSLGLIKETDEMFREGAHRPARLYEFTSKKLTSLSRSFD